MDLEHARTLVNSHLDELSPELRKINSAIHANPEIGFEEFFAHDTLASYLENRGFQVKRQAYGVETSFEATLGTGGRQVVYCAEYDALPGIGHACGHNLIATSSLAAFLGAAHAMSTLKIAGRLRLLGTPAEEGGGGKIKLIEAGAFSPTTDVAAAIMAHPTASHQFDDLGMGVSGLAGLKLISSYKFKIEFRGQTAHAASEPWHGRNALDAAVAAYANVGLLRQQIRPDERIHAVIEDGGTVPNVITEYTRMNWNVRSPTVAACEKLVARVKACLDAAASATGCEISYTMFVVPAPPTTFHSTSRPRIKSLTFPLYNQGSNIHEHAGKPLPVPDIR